MAQDKSYAIQDLLWFAQRVKGIVEIIPDLQKLNDVEKGIEGAINDKATAVKDHLDIQGKLKAAKEELNTLLLKADQAVAAGKKQAEALVAQGNRIASDIVANAQGKAKDLADAAKIELANVQQDLQEALSQHKKVQTAITLATEQHTKIQKAISDLKAKL